MPADTFEFPERTPQFVIVQVVQRVDRDDEVERRIGERKIVRWRHLQKRLHFGLGMLKGVPRNVDPRNPGARQHLCELIEQKALPAADVENSGVVGERVVFGNALGNQNATNTYGVTLRHAYAYWDGWLAGQTWSNFMDVAALPEAVDFIGPTDGVIFVRQAQVRYTSGGFSVAIENPETTIIPNGGGGAVASDRGALPDLTVRYGWKGSWGSFGIGGLLRELRIDRNATADVAAIDDSSFAGAFTVGGKWNIGSSDDLRYQLTVGNGFSRYVGLGITGDSMLDADGDLDALGGVAGFVGWRHAFSPKLRSNVVFARSQYDNDDALTGGGVTRNVQSWRVNLLYSPLPKLDIGAELMYGQRELEDGRDGDLTRLQFTTKYSF